VFLHSSILLCNLCRLKESVPDTSRATLHGAVTKVEWTNPHARFYVDVKDESGKVTNWNLELASPNALRRLGWTRDFLKVGTEVTVDAVLAKDGSNMASAKSVILADGRKMVAGSLADAEK
jgi:hypothetical protein